MFHVDVSSTKVHWTVALCFLRYLRETLFQSLLYLLLSSLELHAYSDAYWISDLIEHKSTIDFYIFFEDSYFLEK